MIIGHFAVAYAARARWRRIPLPWLLLATMAPDLLRLCLAPWGVGMASRNDYSHALPWSIGLAAGAALVAWMVRRDKETAWVIGLVVLSHIALDMLSGRKPLWVGGPNGLNLQQFEPLEFVIEGALLYVGWRLLRQREQMHPAARKLALALMLLGEAGYLTTTLLARPYATRCIEHPIQPCWKRRRDQPPTSRGPSDPLRLAGVDGFVRKRPSG
ncbi:MAG: hypothetical protein LH467_01985 [Gemmatimonadaceae bacterium]|nr:hypothetical protein [Gemmatimonadaceae bacterium]